MNWYVDYFRDESLRITDPDGYALGVTVGFILIPLAVIVALVVIGVLLWPKSTEDEDPVHPSHDML